MTHVILLSEDGSHITRWIRLWKKRLGLDSYAVIAERISLFQVSDHYCRVGNNFVGVFADQKKKLA